MTYEEKHAKLNRMYLWLGIVFVVYLISALVLALQNHLRNAEVGMVVGCLISGSIGAVIGNMKGRPALGLILGFLLPLFGCVLILLISDDVRPKCSNCGNPIENASQGCLYCNSVSLDDQATHANDVSLSETSKAVWAKVRLVGLLFILTTLTSALTSYISFLRDDVPHGDLISFVRSNAVWCLPVVLFLTLLFCARKYERWTERQYDRLKSRSASNSHSSEQPVPKTSQSTELPLAGNFIPSDSTPSADE